jgi:cytochrome P450
MSDAASLSLAAAFDLTRLPDAFFVDPYSVYRALREREPVKRMPDGSLLLTRHADLVAVYKDVRTFSSDKQLEFGPKYGIGSPLHAHHTTSLVFNDPPLHTRVRRLIAGALTPKHVQAMEARLEALVEGLLDDLARRQAAAPDEPVDLIGAFAAAIPIEVIGNLLDVPHAERGPLRAWSLAILGALEPVLTPEQEGAGHAAVRDFLAWLETLVARRRDRPGDPELDVLSRLLAGEHDGERLSAAELLHNCIFLLNAGHETTTNLIGNGLALLDAWPEAKARLVAEPELLRTAIEEFLRMESSNQLGNRIAVGEGSIGGAEGVAVAPGTRITLCIGAANRDPAAFEDPDRLDLARHPNRHLAFGSGIHQCVGMGLARLEAKVAMGAFLARFPHYRITSAVRARRVRFRGHERLGAVLA